MDVMERLDRRLSTELQTRGWRRHGTRRFVGRTHVIDVVPGGEQGRLTMFVGRYRTPGNPTRLADVSRITVTGSDELDRFLKRF